MLEASEEAWTKRSFDPGPRKVYASTNHVRNFLDCMRSREACIAPAETAHRSITPGHLGYVSQTLGRPIDWDPGEERPVQDEEAQRLLAGVTYREPWEFEQA